jgi:hypothetical protein
VLDSYNSWLTRWFQRRALTRNSRQSQAGLTIGKCVHDARAPPDFLHDAPQRTVGSDPLPVDVRKAVMGPCLMHAPLDKITGGRVASPLSPTTCASATSAQTGKASVRLTFRVTAATLPAIETAPCRLRLDRKSRIRPVHEPHRPPRSYICHMRRIFSGLGRSRESALNQNTAQRYRFFDHSNAQRGVKPDPSCCQRGR